MSHLHSNTYLQGRTFPSLTLMDGNRDYPSLATLATLALLLA